MPTFTSPCRIFFCTVFGGMTGLLRARLLIIYYHMIKNSKLPTSKKLPSPMMSIAPYSGGPEEVLYALYLGEANSTVLD